MGGQKHRKAVDFERVGTFLTLFINGRNPKLEVSLFVVVEGTQISS